MDKILEILNIIISAKPIVLFFLLDTATLAILAGVLFLRKSSNKE